MLQAAVTALFKTGTCSTLDGLHDKCCFCTLINAFIPAKTFTNKTLWFVFCGPDQQKFKCHSVKASADRLIGCGFKTGTLLQDYSERQQGEEVGLLKLPNLPF